MNAKLFSLAAAFALALVSSANAQWSSNGNKIYYNDGKVGIGVGNPQSPLSIASAIGAGNRPTLQVKMTNTDPESFNAAIKGINRGTGLNGIGVWGTQDGSGWGVYGTVLLDGWAVYGRCFGDGTAIRGRCDGTGYAGYFQGGMNYFEGSVGIGEETPLFDLHLANNSAAKPTSNTWTISSDRRLKKNINPIQNALEKLMALHGVTYQWKNPETQGNMTGTYTGMIAQDVEKVFPEWVSEGSDGFKTVTVTGFEGIVVEALRELRAEKDAEIADLHAENQAAIAALQAEKDAEIAELRAMMLAMKAELDAMKSKR